MRMKRIIGLAALAALGWVLQAKTVHRSFTGGYPSTAAAARQVGCAASVKVSAGTLVGRVTRVSDGDTLWVTDAAGVRSKVRLDRIDAPESDQPWGKESAAYLKGLVDGKSVKVEWRKHDQYGRYLGIIWLNGTDINLQMVETGNAWHYAYYDKTPAYAAAQVAARKAGRGLWADAAPVNPYDWRKGRRTASVIPLAAADGTPETAKEVPIQKIEVKGTPHAAGKVASLSGSGAGFSDQPIGAYGSGRKEYFAGRNPKVGARPACPVTDEFPDTGYWLSTNSGKRHGRRCENYRKTRGYPCGPTDGTPCGRCKGR